jgi:hypothetical protein
MQRLIQLSRWGPRPHQRPEMGQAAGRLEGVGPFLQALRHQSRGGPLARSSPLDLSARRLEVAGYGPTVKGAERLPRKRVAHESRAGRGRRDPWSACVDGPGLQGSGAGGEVRSPSPPVPTNSAWPTADRPGDISLAVRTIFRCSRDEPAAHARADSVFSRARACRS